MPSAAVAWLTIDGMGAAYATREPVIGPRRYHAPMGVEDGWVELGDRFFVRRYAFYDQNIGLILGDGEALVIDTAVHARAGARDPGRRPRADRTPRSRSSWTRTATSTTPTATTSSVRRPSGATNDA